MYKAFLTNKDKLLVVHKKQYTRMFYLDDQEISMSVPDRCYDGKFFALKVSLLGSFNSVKDIENMYPEHIL